MTFRSPSIAAVALSCVLDFAHAAPNEIPASFERDESVSSRASVSPVEASLSAYRQYAKTQAATLVGMTRVLASAVKHGDLDAAQMAYAPAHKYLQRIAPIARALHLDKSMDARADAFQKKEADPAFSGFHRLEYGLFANKSTVDLSDKAVRLDKDARELRARLASYDIQPTALIEDTIRDLQDIVDSSLTGDEERYSRTDLWDVEASIDGARQVVAMLQSRPHARDSKILASMSIQLARIDALIETHKVGCGFKSYDELGHDDRLALKAPIMALADALASLRGTLAMD